MIWLYERLMVLWDNLINRHEKSVKIIICALLLVLCAAVALQQVIEMISR